MFRIEGNRQSDSVDRKVIDTARCVQLQYITGRGEEGGKVLKLVVGEKIIPFEMAVTHFIGPDGREHYLNKFDTFGSSVFATLQGIPEVEFSSDEERDGFMLLAAEAVLAFGDGYNGLSRPEGYNVVELNGQRYTLASFGYSGPDSACE